MATDLDLSHGKLHGADVPSDLTGLDLSHNGLTELPRWVGGLRSLVWLDLSHNRLTALPEWIRDLPHLSRLVLDGNPFPGVPEHLPPSVAIFDVNEGRSAW